VAYSAALILEDAYQFLKWFLAKEKEEKAMRERAMVRHSATGTTITITYPAKSQGGHTQEQRKNPSQPQEVRWNTLFC